MPTQTGHEGLFLKVAPAQGEPFTRELGEGEITVGRARDNALPLSDASLSRHHARVRVGAEGVWLEDLASRNGTLLNGSPVSCPTRLTPGDRIQLGGSEMELRRRSPVSLAPRGGGGHAEASAVFEMTRLSSTTRDRLDFADVKAENRALSLVTRASSLLIAHRPLPEILDEILILALEAFGADRAAIAMLRSSDAAPEVAAARGHDGPIELKLSRTVVAEVLEHARAIAVVDVDADPRLSSSQSVRIAGVNSLMCAPLWTGSSVSGFLHVDRKMARGDYSEADLRVLAMLANVVAIKVENARLVEEAMAKQRFEEELRVAARIQRRLMPDQPPAVDGLDVSGLCRSCSDIGGDFFDVFTLPGGHLGLVIADVCGKGVGGALLAASLQAALRGASAFPLPVAERMASLNQFVHEHSTVDRYITAAYVELDPGTGELVASSAGHPPPLILRKDGSVDRMEEGGVPLGLVAHSSWQSGTRRLEEGDRLVLYTDGVTEAAPAGLREPYFGTEGLISAARQGSNAESACRAIFDALTAFTGGAPLRDDATALVALRRTSIKRSTRREHPSG